MKERRREMSKEESGLAESCKQRTIIYNKEKLEVEENTKGWGILMEKVGG